MITPWLPVISEEKPRFWGENLVLFNPWFTHDRPMIYPWQPVIFSRVRMCPLHIENIAEKMFFSLKNGIPWDDQFERFACSVDNSNFSATVGWPQSTLRTGIKKVAWEGWAGAFVKFWTRTKFATKIIEASSGATKWPEPPSLQNWNLVSEKSTNQWTDPISKYNMFRKWLCSITLFALFSASLFFHGSLCSFGHALLAAPSLILSFSHVFFIC